jgi:hypothetical protein
VAQEVIDQQIGSGERILRHLRKAPVRKRRISALDSAASASLTERMVILYRELGILVLELLETLVETPTAMQVIARWLGLRARAPGADGSSSSGSYADTPSKPLCSVRISSRKFAAADVSWLGGAILDDPHVAALHKKEAPPIENIAYVADARAFRIAVPDDQPPGAYAGAIISQRTGHALGALVLRIFPDPAERVQGAPSGQ